MLQQNCFFSPFCDRRGKHAIIPAAAYGNLEKSKKKFLVILVNLCQVVCLIREIKGR